MSEPPGERAGLLVRLAAWLQDDWPTTFTIVGPIAMAVLGLIIGATTSSKRPWLLWASVVLFIAFAAATVAGGIVELRRRPRLAKLQAEVATLRGQHAAMIDNYKELIRRHLVVLSRDRLNFGPDERVSVYRHNGQMFELLGRYSANQVYAKPGRSLYPDNQGCIGRAWQSGDAYISCLPNPDGDMDGYLRESKDKWRLPMAVGRSLRMKSRSYAAFALDDIHGNRIAVIVFESTRTDVLNFEELCSEIKGAEGHNLIDFIETMQPFEPSLNFAQREGF